VLLDGELLALDPRAKVTVETVGRGRHRVVLIDGFYRHPDRVLELARTLSYVSGPMHGNFPGGRAVISLDTGPLIAAVSVAWGAPLEPAQLIQPVVFSAIVNRPGMLNLAQRQPHVDPGVSAMVYLNPDAECTGGTGLYRHRPTDLERLPTTATPEVLRLAERLELDPAPLRTPQGYTQFQETIIFNPLFARPDDGYIDDGNAYWELLYKVEMRFNRLVVFDGRMFHSQHLSLDRFRDRPRLNQILYLKERS
jgi:hypothetical protein